MTKAAIKVSSVDMEARKALSFRTGDTVRVWVKVEEKGKTRLQAFEGTVLARKGGTQAGATFTVRRTAGGFGVEKIFPLYAPMIDRVEMLRTVTIRRSKLYHVRDKAAHEIRRQMRKMRIVEQVPASKKETPAAEAPEAETEETKSE
ncbi:MAG: large subunit ribosomal protein [Patescibacteria group bacterium]|jgi:large subunit ribosomal protein L19|nr:large subunit ribosomal protein [Patescibacteria group bacterium]